MASPIHDMTANKLSTTPYPSSRVKRSNMALAVFACAVVLAATKSFIPSISGSRSIAARIARIISRASISFLLVLFSLDARLAASALSSLDAASALPNAFVLPNRLAFDVADPRDDDEDEDEEDDGGDNRSIARRRSSSLANRGFESPSPRSFDPARATTAPRRSRRARRGTAEADAEDEADAARVVLPVGAARVHRATSMTRARVNDFRFRRGHRTDHATDGRALDEAEPGGGARAADDAAVLARLPRARRDDDAASDAARGG